MIRRRRPLFPTGQTLEHTIYNRYTQPLYSGGSGGWAEERRILCAFSSSTCKIRRKRSGGGSGGLLIVVRFVRAYILYNISVMYIYTTIEHHEDVRRHCIIRCVVQRGCLFSSDPRATKYIKLAKLRSAEPNFCGRI